MWAIILVLASGAHAVVHIPPATIDATEARSCMRLGNEAAQQINNSDVTDKVVSFMCTREA